MTAAESSRCPISTLLISSISKMSLSIVLLCLALVIGIYFYNNPLQHGPWFLSRRFINWFPLGMTYAFLYMGRYNLTIAKNSLGNLMSNEDFGLIFAAGTATYAFSFLINGPLVDKIGGKRGILIAAAGASAMNITLGVITWLVLTNRLHVRLLGIFSVDLRAQHVFPKLRRRLDHQGQGELVPCPGTRHVRSDFWHINFVRHLFRIRLGTGPDQPDQSDSAKNWKRPRPAERSDPEHFRFERTKSGRDLGESFLFRLQS